MAQFIVIAKYISLTVTELIQMFALVNPNVRIRPEAVGQWCSTTVGERTNNCGQIPLFLILEKSVRSETAEQDQGVLNVLDTTLSVSHILLFAVTVTYI